MKTYLTFGFAIALGISLLSLVLYFLGFHSDASRFATAQWINSLGCLIILVGGIVIGTKARRARVPSDEPFGYGRALGAGVMITLFATLFGAVANYLYFHVVNPGFGEIIVEAQLEKMRTAGTPEAQLEQAEKGIRMFLHPAAQAVFGILMGLFWGTLISLITAAFLKREAVQPPPPATA